MSKKKEVERILEAWLFASSDPLPLTRMRELLEPDYKVTLKELRLLLDELKKRIEKEERGFVIEEIGGGFLLRTPFALRAFVERLMRERRFEKLSRAALETVAVIACKQPMTRAQLEALRGVDSSGTLASLLERGLIEVVGHLEAPGRPAQYAVTPAFLKHFGLKSVQEVASLMKISD